MSSTRPGERPRFAAVAAALAIVYVVWGSTYLAIRIVAQSMPPVWAAAVRFAAAGLLLAAVLAATRGWRALRVKPRQAGSAVIVGVLLLTGGNGFVSIAESPQFALPSGIAALVIALTPIVLVVLRALSGDRPARTTVIGVIVGLAGLAVLFLPGLVTDPDPSASRVPVVGASLVLISVACWSVGSFATRWLPMPVDPFVASAYEMVAGSVAMAGLASARGETPPWAIGPVPLEAWLALVYLLLFGSLVAYTAYVWLLQRVPISLVATYAYVNPIIALALGALVVGEALTRQVLLASAAVTFGVVLVVSTERPRQRSE